MTLNLETQAYMKNGQTQQAGARLVIHDPESIPLVDEHGIDLSPNALTKVAIQEVL